MPIVLPQGQRVPGAATKQSVGWLCLDGAGQCTKPIQNASHPPQLLPGIGETIVAGFILSRLNPPIRSLSDYLMRQATLADLPANFLHDFHQNPHNIEVKAKYRDPTTSPLDAVHRLRFPDAYHTCSPHHALAEPENPRSSAYESARGYRRRPLEQSKSSFPRPLSPTDCPPSSQSLRLVAKLEKHVLWRMGLVRPPARGPDLRPFDLAPHGLSVHDHRGKAV